MTEPEGEYEKLRRAARELSEPGRFVIEPVEESAAAVRDETPPLRGSIAGRQA